MSISLQPLIRKHSYLGHGNLCLLSFHEFRPQGSCPGMGLEVKKLGHFKKCYTTFSFMLTPKDIMLEISHPYEWAFMSWGEGQCDISCLSDFALYMYLEDYLMDECHTWDNGSVWHKNWPHTIYVGQWPTFHGPAILHILKTSWWINIKHLDNESVRCKLWPQNKCRSQWPIFHA